MGKVIKMRGVATDENEFGPELRIDADTGEILNEEGQPTGQTLEDLADRYLPPFVIAGAQQRMDLDCGGKAQQVFGSMLKLKSGNLPIDGQFPIGAKVVLQIEVEIEACQFKPVRSTYTGEILGIDRVHTGTVEAAKTLQPE